MDELESEFGWEQTPRPPFVTYALCASCVLVFLLQLKEGSGSSNIGYPGYVDGFYFFKGQYWGLLTSFFLHASITHIAFNLYWLYHFGKAVEPYIGWWRYFLFWLAATAISSLVQILVSGESGVGASGFGYALFGLVWIGSRNHPYLARALDRQTVVLFIIWLFVCFFLTWTGTAPIGNGAHVGGMLFGCLCAYAFLVRDDIRWKWSVAAVLLLSLLPIFYAPWLGSWNLVQAEKSYSRGKYETTLTYLDRVNLPEYATYVVELRGNSLSQLGRNAEAATSYKSLLDLHDETELADAGYVYNEYAWILATSPNDKIRNPDEAIRYAKLACDKDGYKDSNSLDTLAAAYASGNQFDQAIIWEQKAIDAHSNEQVLEELKTRLKLFQSRKPYLDSK